MSFQTKVNNDLNKPAHPGEKKMSICTSDLIPLARHAAGFTYKITIETGMRGYGRLNVACLKPKGDDIENSQGADLSASECRALANMLLATASLLDGGT